MAGGKTGPVGELEHLRVKQPEQQKKVLGQQLLQVPSQHMIKDEVKIRGNSATLGAQAMVNGPAVAGVGKMQAGIGIKVASRAMLRKETMRTLRSGLVGRTSDTGRGPCSVGTRTRTSLCGDGLRRYYVNSLGSFRPTLTISVKNN